MILNIASTLTVNGSILVDGQAGDLNGSGGSIFITAGSLTGAGTLSATGGTGGTSSGGGGRVAIIASTSSWAGTVNVYSGSSGFANGSAGTLFIKTPGNNGNLIIDNGSLGSSFYTQLTPGNYVGLIDNIQLRHKGRLWMQYPSTYTITSVGNVTGDVAGDELRLDGLLNTPASLTISSYTLTFSSFSTMPSLTYLDIGYAGELNIGGNTQAPVANLSSMTIENNGVLTHWANSTSEVHKINLALSTMTMNTGSQINVTGMGYAASQGPGARTGSCGPCYGGQGGGSGCNPTYGSFSAPTNLGSGADGPGGGAVILNISQTFLMNGTIQTEGVPGGWAGSGGSVYIQAASLNGNGVIDADGGSPVGGGGRIAVIGSTASFTGTIKAYGTGGAAGTIFSSVDAQHERNVDRR